MSGRTQQSITIADLLEQIVHKINEEADPALEIETLRAEMARRGSPHKADELISLAVFRQAMKSVGGLLP